MTASLMRSCFVKENSFCDLSKKYFTIFSTKVVTFGVISSIDADPSPTHTIFATFCTNKNLRQKKGFTTIFWRVEGVKTLDFLWAPVWFGRNDHKCIYLVSLVPLLLGIIKEIVSNEQSMSWSIWCTWRAVHVLVAKETSTRSPMLTGWGQKSALIADDFSEIQRL